MDATKLDQAIVTLFIVWALGMVVSVALAWIGRKVQGYMAKQIPMGGAKLSRRVVDRLRQLGDKCDVAAEARKYQLHPKTIRRILTYETWVEPEHVATDDEHKQCLWCGGIFERRYTSGRWRTDEQWEAKRTCNASCNMYLMWKDGVYINRQH